MLCPWCLHYGAEDDEYLFDEELYCGLCAQQLPQTDADWLVALQAMDATGLSYVEHELNRIAVSKSGLQAALLAEMGDGIAALAALRDSLEQARPVHPDAQHVRWVRFACSYFAPQMR